ncbi:MAG: hypothetical protein R3C26_04535 [Calditrichia bacterium]
MGERHFLPRLFKHEYPENLEIDEHVNRSTRTAWHHNAGLAEHGSHFLVDRRNTSG